MRYNRSGFTLVELLVVVTIIVILLALMAPALDKAVEAAQRAKCAANMHSIATGAVTYAILNKRVLFICRARGITISFAQLGKDGSSQKDGYQSSPGDLLVDWPAALASVGLAGAKTQIDPGHIDTNRFFFPTIDNPLSKVWDCPSRTYTTAYDLPSGSVITTYQYFGGVRNWTNAEGTRKSRSPSRLSDGGGRTMLVADFTWESSPWTWGAGSTTPWINDTPPHRNGEPNNRPAGHNQAYLDDSAEWLPADKLIFIHDWWGAGDYSQPLYGYQDNLGDYTPSAAMYLKNNP